MFWPAVTAPRTVFWTPLFPVLALAIFALERRLPSQPPAADLYSRPAARHRVARHRDAHAVVRGSGGAGQARVRMIQAGQSVSASSARRRRLVSPRLVRGRAASVSLNNAQRRCIRAVADRIESGQYAMVHDRCVCGESEAFVIARVDRYGLPLDTVLCEACGTLRFDPYLSGGALADFYGSVYQEMYARFTDPDAYWQRQQSYGRRLLAFAQHAWRRGACVVEVGCGAGGALAVFQEAGYEVLGCEYSQPLLELGRSRGVRDLHLGGSDVLSERLARKGNADLIFLHHVLEHMSAPRDFLETAKRMVSDRGMIIVAVPDVTGIDRFPFPSGNLRLFLHIAHKYNFTAKGLGALARRVGLCASVVPVEPSVEAPEMWVGFAPHPIATDADTGEWLANGEDLFRKLRRIERRFIRDTLLSKLGGPFRRRADCIAARDATDGV